MNNPFYTLVTNRSLLGCTVEINSGLVINKVSKVQTRVGVIVILEGDVSPDEYGKLRSRRIKVNREGLIYECDYSGTNAKFEPEEYISTIEEEITPTPIFNTSTLSR